MVVSYYAYNLLKIPGPIGVVTIHDDFDLDQECEDYDTNLADPILVEETGELTKYSDSVNLDDLALLKNPHL
jgi:hypothetical protein